jgi:hypothetical protein
MRRRSGVIDAAGLAAIGYDKNAREVLRRRHRAVYVVDGLAPFTRRGELFAATLALGGHEAFLSHRTALAIVECARIETDTEDVSGLEREFAAWLAAHPEIPPPRRNVHVGPWEFDFFWPDHGVVLETDGDPYHTISPDVERDRLKDAWVQRRKMAILRVTEFRFAHDRPGVLSDLLAMLDLHSARS